MRFEDGKDDTPGQITIKLGLHEQNSLFIAVQDNGIGLPKDSNPIHLTEPYVTHKPKGTGLGLAIVKKIMEDHGGELVLGSANWLNDGDQQKSGATMILIFPRQSAFDSQNQKDEKAAINE